MFLNITVNIICVIYAINAGMDKNPHLPQSRTPRILLGTYKKSKHCCWVFPLS